jgi:HAD superfamily hydrolase (TIGR01509 family)
MTPGDSLAELVRGVELLCLDAGNTVIFLDHARMAAACEPLGFRTDAQSLARAEGETKLAQERGEELSVAWSQSHREAARGWGKTVGTILARAGLAESRVPQMLETLWLEHVSLNLWSRIPEGLVEALGRAREAAVRVAVVSNSEGVLARVFEQLGILDAVDLVVDSGVVGVEKPDPRIFRVALDHFGVAPERALHLGDNFSTDVLGARAAGIRVALVDPLGHLDGRHLDVPRVPGAAVVADAAAEAHRSSR